MTRINKGIPKTFVHLSKASRQHCTVIIHPDQNIHKKAYLPRWYLLNYNEKVQLPVPGSFSSPCCCSTAIPTLLSGCCCRSTRKKGKTHIHIWEAFEFNEAHFKWGTRELGTSPAPFQRWSRSVHSSLWEDARSITYIQRFLYPLYKRHFSEAWMDICCQFLPTGQSTTQTPCTVSFPCSFPFQSPQATTSSLLPPPGSRPPHFLSHKILSNLNPTEDIQLQSCMMLKSCLYVFDTCRVRYGYTRILYAMLHCICTNLISGTPQKHEVWKVHILAFFASSQNLSFSCRITLILMGNSVTSTPLGFLKSA